MKWRFVQTEQNACVVGRATFAMVNPWDCSFIKLCTYGHVDHGDDTAEEKT